MIHLTTRELKVRNHGLAAVEVELDIPTQELVRQILQADKQLAHEIFLAYAGAQPASELYYYLDDLGVTAELAERYINDREDLSGVRWLEPYIAEFITQRITALIAPAAAPAPLDKSLDEQAQL